MFEIMKHEKSKRDAIVNNPIEMKNIIKEVEQEYLPGDLEERRKKMSSRRRRESTSSSRSSSNSSDSRRHKSKKSKHSRHSKHSKHSKSKSHKHSHRHRRRSSSSERSESRSRSRDNDFSSDSKKSFKQSKLFKDYIRDRFGGIAKEDENGNLKPDYSMHKKKYKTEYQLNEEDRRRRMEKLRENAKRLEEMRAEDG